MPKTVYIGMTADILHHGHIGVIETGRRYGDVVIGLLTDRAASRFNGAPYPEYRHRKRILENISGVKAVIPQEDRDYGPNLRKIRPDYMIHTTDWLAGPQRRYRDQAFAAMAEWGGEIIEVPCAEDVDTARPTRRSRAGDHPDRPAASAAPASRGSRVRPGAGGAQPPVRPDRASGERRA